MTAVSHSVRRGRRGSRADQTSEERESRLGAIAKSWSTVVDKGKGTPIGRGQGEGRRNRWGRRSAYR